MRFGGAKKSHRFWFERTFTLTSVAGYHSSFGERRIRIYTFINPQGEISSLHLTHP